MFFFHSLLVWGAVILITALSYATGLRGDESGTASNSTIEKAFDAGPGGALSLFLTVGSCELLFISICICICISVLYGRFD